MAEEVFAKLGAKVTIIQQEKIITVTKKGREIPEQQPLQPKERTTNHENDWVNRGNELGILSGLLSPA
ncbi:hypothetical protein [uncultured Brevibacillus sp.]|uniref:hypothetical protein n=1 Tax=uncultured Brevibacillus sp. TaxID=169970 RepID=UPI00259931D3|nr:hypothetical protein [uncultured Brevibacillus sp.]